MKPRGKRDFTRVDTNFDVYANRWVANLEDKDTTMTMSYGPDGPECTFHYDGKFMVAQQFEGVTG